MATPSAARQNNAAQPITHQGDYPIIDTEKKATVISMDWSTAVLGKDASPTLIELAHRSPDMNFVVQTIWGQGRQRFKRESTTAAKRSRERPGAEADTLKKRRTKRALGNASD